MVEFEATWHILKNAKNDYIKNLKSELLADKAGFVMEYKARGQNMPKIIVDNIEYNTEDLTDKGKAQLASLQFLEVQITKLKNEVAVFQTARNTYVKTLQDELEKSNSKD